MVRVHIKIILFCLIVGCSYSHQCYAGIISEPLQKKLSLLNDGETISVIVQCSQHPEFKQYMQGRTSAPQLIASLKNISARNTANLTSSLESIGYKGTLTAFWINNTFVLDVTKSLAETIATLPYVTSIIENEKGISTDGLSKENISAPPITYNAAWNIKTIKADSVWLVYGITGSSITIGSMDTGVDITHPAIAAKFRGGATSWYDAINGNSTPYDDAGHGTHTTGTLLGGDGPGNGTPDSNDIGIAYGARFIAAKMLTSGAATIAQVTSAAQWMLDPDANSETNDFPHVINNSWFSGTRGSTWFVDAATAWRTAGIIPVFCAANYGPATSSTRSPGDYANCLSIGATTINDERYNATSVGPSPAGTPFPSDRRKPDVSAPGDAVRSSIPDGGFAYMSGTSMATPHVTGTIALMLEANPDLTYDEIFDILQHTAVDLGDSGYDYIYGYGRINALYAVREALKFRVNIIQQENLATSESGDSAIMSIQLRVIPFSPVHVHISLSDTTEGILVSDSIITFTSADWYLPQTILLRGLPDDVADGNVTYHITAQTYSNDPLYNHLTQHSASITNIDGITFQLQSRWNLVSIPMIVTNNNVKKLFPEANGSAFAYTQTGYQTTAQLINGTGYWLNMDSTSNVIIAGTPFLSDTIHVMAGWNLIGSLTYPVEASTIISIPPGIQTSTFFQYNQGYISTDTIHPGKGYWIKVNQSGTLILTASPQ